ncbi:MAG: sulfotransferase [Candidatus Brocadiaceae bacterium]|nr:sulfotransferase [Candidatus Brocadiaceae bacterium]
MIFLVGSSRSGTTWLAKLFDSHPQVLYRHEPDSIVFDNSIPYQPNPDEIEPLADKAGNYLKVMSNTRYPKNSGQRPFFNKTYRGRIGNYLFPITIYGVKVLEQAFPYFRKK